MRRRTGAGPEKRGTCQVIAEAVAVICPFCGADQPSPDGEDTWTPDELAAHQGKRDCVSCDEPISIMWFPHAQIEASPGVKATDAKAVTP